MNSDYSSTPLFKKLGLHKPELRCDIVNAPDELFDLLHGMPEELIWDDASDELDFLLTFYPDLSSFKEGLEESRNRIVEGGCWWVATLKGQPKSPNRLSGNEVREILRPMGYIDVKVCSINTVWSGVKYVIRKP